jgi:hypothetical protein
MDRWLTREKIRHVDVAKPVLSGPFGKGISDNEENIRKKARLQSANRAQAPNVAPVKYDRAQASNPFAIRKGESGSRPLTVAAGSERRTPAAIAGADVRPPIVSSSPCGECPTVVSSAGESVRFRNETVVESRSQLERTRGSKDSVKSADLSLYVGDTAISSRDVDSFDSSFQQKQQTAVPSSGSEELLEALRVVRRQASIDEFLYRKESGLNTDSAPASAFVMRREYFDDPASYAAPLGLRAAAAGRLAAHRLRVSRAVELRPPLLLADRPLSAGRAACSCMEFDSVGALFAVATAGGLVRVYDFDECLREMQKWYETSLVCCLADRLICVTQV